MRKLLVPFAVLLAGGAALAQTSTADYARVRNVTPQTERVAVTRDVCETRMVQQVTQPAAPSYGGTIVGGILGGVLGSRIGGGDGRLAATAVGAGVGAVVGNSYDRQGAPAAVAQEVPVQQCHKETTYELQTRGYLVDYEYQGRVYSARLPRDPGQTLRVNVSVTPAPN